jgi:hypothetical protein
MRNGNSSFDLQHSELKKLVQSVCRLSNSTRSTRRDEDDADTSRYFRRSKRNSKRPKPPSADEVLRAGLCMVDLAQATERCASVLCMKLKELFSWAAQIAAGACPKPSGEVSRSAINNARAALRVSAIICVYVEHVGYSLNDAQLINAIPDTEKAPEDVLNEINLDLLSDGFHLAMLPLPPVRQVTDTSPPTLMELACALVDCLNHLLSEMKWIDDLQDNGNTRELPLTQVRNQAHQAIRDLCKMLAGVPARINNEVRPYLQRLKAEKPAEPKMDTAGPST